jgi:hypothetical protein
VIQEKTFRESEIKTRWQHAINKRLTEDKIIATKIKRTDHAIKQLKDTWEPILRVNGELPERWIENSEFLVGRR